MSRARAAIPRAAQKPASRSLHGETVVDPYAWMRERGSEEVLAHLRAENEYVEASLAHQGELREKLFQEIKGRIQETDMTSIGTPAIATFCTSSKLARPLTRMP